MQPTLCSRCHKNVAVIFIQKMEGGATKSEGLCLKCAKELGIKPVEDMMQKMGISDEDLEGLTNEMMSAFGGAEGMEGLVPAEDGDDEEDEGKTATFPFLNKLFGSAQSPQAQPPEREQPRQGDGKEKKGDKPPKRKFLENYCISLTQKAADGKLDRIIGRDEEIQRTIQILNRRQKNNPCLIGEPGVGKTAIAEGLAQKIYQRDVPYKLLDKEVYLLDLTALVAGTQFRGQFESRMKGLIEEIKKLGNIILVIDEVHNIVGAGDAEGSMNAANILKPAHPQARPEPGRDPGHRRHHPHRVPQVHREGLRPGAALPARHGGGALHRGQREDHPGHRPLLREVPLRVHLPRDVPPGGDHVRAVHHRPVPPRQGH